MGGVYRAFCVAIVAQVAKCRIIRLLEGYAFD